MFSGDTFTSVSVSYFLFKYCIFFFKTHTCFSKTIFRLHKLYIVFALCFWVFSLCLCCLCLWERVEFGLSFFKVSLREYAWKCLCMHHLYLTKSVCPYDTTVFTSTVERDQGQSIYTVHVLSDLWNVNSCECSYRWGDKRNKALYLSL